MTPTRRCEACLAPLPPQRPRRGAPRRYCQACRPPKIPRLDTQDALPHTQDALPHDTRQTLRHKYARLQERYAAVCNDLAHARAEIGRLTHYIATHNDPPSATHATNPVLRVVQPRAPQGPFMPWYMRTARQGR